MESHLKKENERGLREEDRGLAAASRQNMIQKRQAKDQRDLIETRPDKIGKEKHIGAKRLLRG